jgi:peptidoglycan/xylan/chitin deacetylase (PgdA/CDA1 family)
MRFTKRKVEISAIVLTAAALCLSVALLVPKIVQANTRDPFPNLYAPSNSVPQIQAAEKTVYLTYDDGPSENTSAVLDVLKEKGVKATFFVTAQNKDEPYTKPDLERMITEGHTIGLHTYSHNTWQTYKSAYSTLEDLNKENEWLIQTVNVKPNILRFAGGSATFNAEPAVMKEVIRSVTDRGYKYFDWDIVSGDDLAVTVPADELAHTVISGCQGLDTVVVLMHDNPIATTTPEATAMIIDELRAQGYTFAPITPNTRETHIVSERLK